MLCPETWNFKAPESTFLSHKTTDPEEFKKTTKKFHYNHLVSVLLPDSFKVPEYITEALNIDCDYYKIIEFCPSELVLRNFLSTFVKTGSLYLLSINTRIDCDNCIGVTPRGELILNLNKTTYQSLGLEGVVSHFHSKSKDRYIITINLNSDHLKSGKPNHERIKRALKDLGKFTVILAWQPTDDTVCPSSIAKYFHDLKYNVKLCKPSYDIRTYYSVPTPDIEHTDIEELVEWFGMLAVGCELENPRDDEFVTTYSVPEPNSTIGQIKCIQWRGLFTRESIENLWVALKKYHRTGIPWVMMYVQGFSDSPVAWSMEEHHYYTNGDNAYILLSSKEDETIICTQQCSRKQYKRMSR